MGGSAFGQRPVTGLYLIATSCERDSVTVMGNVREKARSKALRDGKTGHGRCYSYSSSQVLCRELDRPMLGSDVSDSVLHNLCRLVEAVFW